MKSYASVEGRRGDFVVCEVEMIPVEESKAEDFATKETTMCDISTEEFMYDFGHVEEGDILIVEHDGEEVSHVYCKDEHERQRRIEVIQKLLAQI